VVLRWNEAPGRAALARNEPVDNFALFVLHPSGAPKTTTIL
jgi:hypothetical protein